MKINMKASDLAKLSIIINGDEHEIYANECLDFDIEEKLVVIDSVLQLVTDDLNFCLFIQECFVAITISFCFGNCIFDGVWIAKGT